MLIGRDKETEMLHALRRSQQAEFVALYGRRRVGKTHLIRQVLGRDFAFQHTGIYDVPTADQLSAFHRSIQEQGLPKANEPKTWVDAFCLLRELIENQPRGKKKVIFIDEMPWMDTPRSRFISALDHFWNSWATQRNDILLIVCGSATSWIINNVIMNYGGLHNRLTCKIFLEPFCLSECKDFCKANNLKYTNRQILEAYMAIGGVPYYWSFMKKDLSVAQNIDQMFFAPQGQLIHEFDVLYASLFRNANRHIAIVTALTTKKMGMTRQEILAATKLPDNTDFSTALKELEQCEFVRRYAPIDKKSKNSVFQLMDNYTLFYFDFIKKNTNADPHFWTSQLNTSLHNSWAGRAFERVCIQHLPQIKRALGFDGIVSSAHSWVYKAPKDADGKAIGTGAQIDLLIDRSDGTINLCEMKYTTAPYTISADEDLSLRNRRETFARISKTRKAVILTFISPFGLTPGGYSDDIVSRVLLDDFFC